MGYRANACIGYGLKIDEDLEILLDEMMGDESVAELPYLLDGKIKEIHEERSGEEINIWGYRSTEYFPKRDDYEEHADFCAARDEAKERWLNSEENSTYREYKEDCDSLGIDVAHGGSYDYPCYVILAEETTVHGDWNQPTKIDAGKLNKPENFEERLRRCFDLLGVPVDFDLECGWYLLASWD